MQKADRRRIREFREYVRSGDPDLTDDDRVFLLKLAAEQDPESSLSVSRRQALLANYHQMVGHDVTGCYCQNCEKCGKVFFTARSHAKYCSPTCRKAMYRFWQRQNEILILAAVARCGMCGAQLATHEGGGDLRRSYCSPASRQRAYRVRRKSLTRK
jgi:hypothetical protein